MLEVQKYLMSGKTLNDLHEEYGIETCHHKELPLVILNYSQIFGKKTETIIRECRALCLDTRDFSLIYRSFPRFFNWGEHKEEMDQFDFSKVSTLEKVDGSLCIIYNYMGYWYGNTRGSFGLDKIGFEDFTWRDAFLKAMGLENWVQLEYYLNPTITYVCEFVSPWNKVVREYKEPKIYHLASFKGEEEVELTNCENKKLIFLDPIKFNFTTIQQIEQFLLNISNSDPTFEGVVFNDGDRRFKCKNPKYLSLHRMRGEGDNLYNPKHLLPWILSGEKDELLTYYSEIREKYEQLEQKVGTYYNQLQEIWESTKNIESQKDFALAINGRTPFTGILFNMKKNKGNSLKKLWQESEDLILKVVK